MIFAREGNVLALALYDGESVFEGILRACGEAHVEAAMVVSGIGMLRDAEIGFWDGSKYLIEKYREAAELVSLHGSVAVDEGKLSAHLHVSLSGRDHSCFGGHLVNACVNNVNEIAMIDFGRSKFSRRPDQKSGLRLLNIG
ncbi:MAG: DUF296 domain-containing protein [Thermoplasmata archaeon]|uniref:DNA-binding protein n=1 Tax=Candidatus Sysuiplasma superficiale TaxID=2823368 RepID=A0A8J7YJD6_9ARCH|nr:DNA-binding protein [Candidatus Sysuiplasma superficiale]MBX8644455.1 DUF296 domain-containing protein [Candidatus Sysuiplasma superficiale]MCL4347420.1 DUF296 domain-containing protein [Candidatus Thermoplasmatota archaeon]